jgi:hypothetical protein
LTLSQSHSSDKVISKWIANSLPSETSKTSNILEYQATDLINSLRGLNKQAGLFELLPSYIKNRAAAYGCPEELKIDPMNAMAWALGWDISVIARMPQKGITMKMKAGVIFGQQLAVQADRFLKTIDKSCYPVTGSWMIIREQEVAGVCYLCAMHGHNSVNCPRLKSKAPQIKAEHMGKWYWSTINMQNLPRLYKIRKEPILDPGATVHQQAGTGIWHRDTKKKPSKKWNKKVDRDHSNVNWQGIRCNDVEAVNQAFGTNKVEIKH